MNTGTLYGIGIGPGDPELITLKGARLISACRNLFVPKARTASESVALAIARPLVGPETRIEEIVFPMTADRRDSTRSDSESELEASTAERFTKIADLTASLFPICRGLVFAAPCGVVVRALAPLIKSKYEDPAVVVLDAGGRWAVSLLSGHEGGANDLALRVANLTGAEPVVTTTTEALKSVIVGIGCRRGTPAGRIVAAIREALTEAGVALEEVRFLASAEIKADEAGLLAAAETLGVPIRFIAAEEIRASLREFSHSGFVAKKVNLPAVAEPAALLAGRRTRFICRKKTYNGITIALAREGFLRSESALAGR